MYTYIADYSKNYKSRIDEILDIVYQFDDFPESIETVIRYYMRNYSRIIVCLEGNKIIGAYLYVAGNAFFTQRENSKYLFEILQRLNIKSNECTISIFAVVDKNYPQEIYYEMNKLKVEDAKENGYKYSVVNLNATKQLHENQFCKMSNFSLEKQDLFSELTNTKIETTNFKNDNGVNIVIQHY